MKNSLSILLLIMLSVSAVFGQQRKIIIRGDNNFPPFEYLDEKGNPAGFNVDIIRAILDVEGIDYDFRLQDWETLVKDFNDGKIDIISGTTRNHQWAGSILFGTPYYHIELAIASKRNDRYASFSELKDKRVITRGETWALSFLKSNKITSHITTINDLDSALSLVAGGKYDAVLNSRIGTKYAIEKNHIKSLYVCATHLQKEDFSFCMKKENTDLLYIMNRGLSTIQMSGKYDKIYSKWFDRYEEKMIPRYQRILIIVLIIVGIVLTSFVLIFRHKALIVSQMLTESKRSLIEKNKQLEMAFLVGNIIPLSWDIETDRLYITSSKIKAQYSNFGQKKNITLNFILDNTHPDDRILLLGELNKLRNGETCTIKVVIRYDVLKKFDTYFNLLLLTGKQTTDGKALTAAGYLQDITAQRTANLVLKQNEAFFSEILNAIPFPINVKDVTDGYKYKYWNKQSTIEYGDLLNKSVAEILEEKEVEHIHAIDKMVYDTGEIFFNHESFVTKDGKMHYTIVQKSPITVNEKKMILAVRWDIGKVKELQKGLDAAMRELENTKNKAVQSDMLKSAFLANMSHEIRTPLNAIVGFSQLLSSAETEEEKKEYSNIISANSENLLRLINDILDLSKIEAGFIELKPTDFDLSKLFNVLETTFKQRMKPGVQLINNNPYTSCLVKADKNRLTQVITNFVTNSIKFTEKGSITIGYEAVSNNSIRIYVTDTGSGISEDKKSRVFGRFEKLNNYAQGTGLGLSICKSIVKTAGGVIGFDTQEGKGSTFWVIFPTDIHISN